MKTMNLITQKFGLPILISSVLLLPFIILEFINQDLADFSFPLFGFLWLLSVGFFSLLISMVQRLKAGNGIKANLVGFLVRIVVMIPIAWMWIGVVLDQMPCFLGVPNCD